jgi:hypothetical protein
MEVYGSLRIKNPITIAKWKSNGEWQKLLDKGYIYAEGCGRFRIKVCECCKCKKK